MFTEVNSVLIRKSGLVLEIFPKWILASVGVSESIKSFNEGKE